MLLRHWTATKRFFFFFLHFAHTLGSAVSSLKASYTCLSLTPPPRSRKLAGFPPCRSMMSHVAMAKPAPFTRKIQKMQSQEKRWNTEKTWEQMFSDICCSVWENLWNSQFPLLFLAVQPDHWRIPDGRHASICQLLNTVSSWLSFRLFHFHLFDSKGQKKINKKYCIHKNRTAVRSSRPFDIWPLNSNRSALGPSVAHWKKFSIRLLISDHHNLICSSNVVANFQLRHFWDIASRRMGQKSQKGLMLWLACGHEKKTKWQPLKERGCNERTPTKPVGVQHKISTKEKKKLYSKSELVGNL